ncbi:hypothetical protein [Helicobacter saguini]|nr:hypothetical protein [Helicobacter saguini]
MGNGGIECPACNGKGTYKDDNGKVIAKCEKCNGQGTIYINNKK